MQFIHVGRASSHFTRRLRHVKQPVFDLVLRTAGSGFLGLDDEPADDGDDGGEVDFLDILFVSVRCLSAWWC